MVSRISTNPRGCFPGPSRRWRSRWLLCRTAKARRRQPRPCPFGTTSRRRRSKRRCRWAMAALVPRCSAGVAAERIMLNESTLWTGGPIDPAVNPEAVTFLPKVREALFKGDYQLADQLTRKLQGRYSRVLRAAGRSVSSTPPSGTPPRLPRFRRELDIASAVARTAFSVGRVSFAREYFVSNPDRVLVIRLTASEPGALTFTVRADSQLHHDVRAGRRQRPAAVRPRAHARGTQLPSRHQGPVDL